MGEVSPYIANPQPVNFHSGVAQDGVNSPFPEGQQVDLWNYWRTLQHHRTLILAVLVAAEVLTVLAVFLATPIYTAKSTILIQVQTPQVFNIQDLITGADTNLNTEHDFYRTQYEILKSRGLAAAVVKQLDLEDNPLFVGRGRAGLVRRIFRGLFSLLGQPFSEDQAGSRHEDDGLGVPPEVVDRYLTFLDSRPDPGTRLVRVEFSTPDPVLSARVANAHVREYIQRGMELHAEANEDAQRFLESKLVELKQRIEKSEAALNSYREEHGIIAPPSEDKSKIVLESLSDLNKNLTEAESERIGLEAQVQLLKRDAYESLPQVLSSTLVQQMKSQLASMEGDYASMSKEFTADYPPLIDLRAKISEARSHLQQEVNSIAAGIQSNYQEALAKEQGFREQLSDANAKALALNNASLQDAILAREVDTNEQLYRNVLERMKEMGVAADVPNLERLGGRHRRTPASSFESAEASQPGPGGTPGSFRRRRPGLLPRLP